MKKNILPKVLVTGGAGFIGSHIVDHFLKNGFQVVVIDNLSTGSLVYMNPKADFYKADICDPDISAIFAKERPDYVNHHASLNFSRSNICTPILEAKVSILGSLNLIENAIRYDVKHFLYVSCGKAVYGKPIHLPCNESHPLQPIQSDGICKCAVERYMKCYAQIFKFKYTILRYPEVYGPRQSSNGDQNFIATFIKQMLHGKQPIIYGDGDQRRDFVYVGDCAEANLLAVQNKKCSGIYNLGTGLGTSTNTIFTALREIIDFRQNPIFRPAFEDEIPEIYLDAEKAQQDFKWYPRTDLLEGLRKTVAHYLHEEVVF